MSLSVLLSSSSPNNAHIRWIIPMPPRSTPCLSRIPDLSKGADFGASIESTFFFSSEVNVKKGARCLTETSHHPCFVLLFHKGNQKPNDSSAGPNAKYKLRWPPPPSIYLWAFCIPRDRISYPFSSRSHLNRKIAGMFLLLHTGCCILTKGV